MGLDEWRKRLITWAEEFPSDEGLGHKVLNGLSGELWKPASVGGTAGLKDQGGWRIVLARVEHALLSTGINRQTELLQTCLAQERRAKRRNIKAWVNEFDENRDRLESAL